MCHSTVLCMLEMNRLFLMISSPLVLRMHIHYTTLLHNTLTVETLDPFATLTTLSTNIKHATHRYTSDITTDRTSSHTLNI